MRQPLHVLHTFANNDGVPYISWFMERARKEGTVRYSFLLLYPERPAMLDEIRAHGFQGEWIRFDPRHRKRGMLAAIPRMWWHMMRWRPDIVNGHLFDDTLPAMIAAFLARIKARIVTRQDTGYHLYYAPKWVFMDRLVTKLATRVLAVSEQSRDLMIQHEGALPEKVGVVHHGIPTSSYTKDLRQEALALRHKYGLDGAYPVVGTVARLIEWKGHRHIIEAASILVPSHPEMKFIFCGTGQAEIELRRLVEEAGLSEHVIFLGWVDRRSVPALYQSMDIYLHAADHEPFGFVLAEAMMSGIPVVTTRTGGIIDVAEDGRSAIFVNERNGHALAGGVERSLGLAPRMIGKAGRDVAMEHFSFENMWNGYMTEYRNAVAS
jgi:glycosyltransferase involved in cell wall biosynthesis